MAYRDLRDYLSTLERRGKLHHVKKEVDADWEVTAVMRRVFQRIPPASRPAMMFERFKGFSMPLVAGVLGASPEVYALSLQTTVDKIADKWADAQTKPIPPVRVNRGPVKDVVLRGDQADITKLPLCIWTRGQDPAPYVTAPCVVSKDPETGERNVGTYRLMQKGPRKYGIFLSNAWRDMYPHIMKNEKQGRPTPCAVVIGCDPPVSLTSVARVRGDEFGVAGGLRGEPLEVVTCETNDLEVPAHAEIVVEGFIPPGVREPEGPFGEYTGYMGASGPSFVIEVTAITHRVDPIYQAFFSQMPPSESSCIRGTGRDVALFKHLTRDLRLPVRDVHLLEAGGARRSSPSRCAVTTPDFPSARCGRCGPMTRRGRSGWWSSTTTSTCATTSRCCGRCPGTSSRREMSTSTGTPPGWLSIPRCPKMRTLPIGRPSPLPKSASMRRASTSSRRARSPPRRTWSGWTPSGASTGSSR